MIEIMVSGLTDGNEYHVKASTGLDGFTEVPGSSFTATGTTETIMVPASGLNRIYVVVSKAIVPF